jgi:hypothetical protein
VDDDPGKLELDMRDQEKKTSPGVRTAENVRKVSESESGRGPGWNVKSLSAEQQMVGGHGGPEVGM